MSRLLTTPWAPSSRTYSLPGSLLVKMRLGEAPSQIPTQLDVQRGSAVPATAMDGGAFDRLVRHHVDGAKITRVYSARRSVARDGFRHVDFDDKEHQMGMSRTFRLDVRRGAPVEKLVSVLRQLATVESATPHYCCRNPLAVEAGGAAPTDIAQAWIPRDMVCAREALGYEAGDRSVITAIVDTGVSANHRETNGRFRGGFNTVQLTPNDFGQGVELLGRPGGVDTRPVDEHVGHGMACAGIIGAWGENIPPGIGGDCWLLPVRVLGAARLPGKDQPVGLGCIADIDAGMKMAVDLGARIINMSFGTSDEVVEAGLPKPHADICRYAADRGCILIAASGNSGREEKYWPAAFDEVIAVGSVDGEGRPSRFTTHGEHLALCAPGEHIATCALLDGYQLATGTSFAAPFVTAAAALLMSRAGRRSFPLDGTSMKSILIVSATPWPREQVGYGAGILNIYQALRELDRRVDQDPATAEMLYAEPNAARVA